MRMPTLDTAADCLALLKKVADPSYAKTAARFFKTGKGQYGEGDVFLGIRVPQTRLIARQCRELSLPQITLLLRSPFHEARLLGLIVLVNRYERGDKSERKQIGSFYLRHKPHINNWDLVDATAPYILGPYIREYKAEALRDTLIHSPRLWHRRMAIVSTFADLRAKDTAPVLLAAEQLLADEEDLMHKACGWLLREAGKVNMNALRAFLTKHKSAMPRTMLRYAIEKMSQTERKHWMA